MRSAGQHDGRRYGASGLIRHLGIGCRPVAIHGAAVAGAALSAVEGLALIAPVVEP